MIGIVKMPIANLRSIYNSVHESGFDVCWVDAGVDLDGVTHLIVPGVGHFRAVMRDLEERGLAGIIRSFAASGRPLLGICVGMQLLATTGFEGSETRGLDLIPGAVAQLSGRVRVPHVGWNTVELARPHPVFAGIKPQRDFYFVHSYAFATLDPADILGQTDYGTTFTSVIGRGNIIGLQFHPEKSQINGLKILENFCTWDGAC